MQELSFWSLLEMLGFHAAALSKIQQNLCYFLHSAAQANISDASVQQFVDNLEALRKVSIPLELKSVIAQIDRIREGLGQGIPNNLLATLIMELQNRITDELRLQTVLMVPFNKRELYEHPEPLFGKDVQDAFPTAALDIDEAGKCLALGRATACVFHLQRAVEVSLKVLAVNLKQPFDRNSWDAHLKDIERELERLYKASGARTPDEKFYSEAAAQLGHVKTAWRNPTMHVDRTHTTEDGLNILNAIKALMRHLAIRLHE